MKEIRPIRKKFIICPYCDFDDEVTENENYSTGENLTGRELENYYGKHTAYVKQNKDDRCHIEIKDLYQFEIFFCPICGRKIGNYFPVYCDRNIIQQ